MCVCVCVCVWGGARSGLLQSCCIALSNNIDQVVIGGRDDLAMPSGLNIPPAPGYWNCISYLLAWEDQEKAGNHKRCP